MERYQVTIYYTLRQTLHQEPYAVIELNYLFVDVLNKINSQ